MAMTKAQAESRINELLQEYGYADSWPASCQVEYEELCAVLHRQR